MTYHLLKPDRKTLSDSGYASVAHVPFLIRDDGFYPALANRYLRARSLLEWPLQLGTSSEPSKPTKPTRSTRRFQTLASCVGLGGRLKQFLEWVDAHAIDIAEIDFAGISKWQEGLSDGRSSASGKALQPATINLYINEACYYLTWLSLIPRDDKGHHVRGPFEITTSERRSTGGNLMSLGPVRASRLPHSRRSIQLPLDAEVARWMRALRIRAEVKAMIAEVILDSGMRISEANQMEVTTLPERSAWTPVGGRIHFWISKGVKGAKITADSIIAVRSREISLSTDVADKVDRYRAFARETQIRRWIRAGESLAEQTRRARNRPKRLWLSETSNMPFANQQIRHAWRTTTHCPKDWHPHQGRTWFAVEMLVRFAQNAHASRQSDIPDFAWLDSVIRNQIELLIRPALGHMSVETTKLYLRAALYRLEALFEAPSLRWQGLMDADNEEPDSN